MVVNPGGRRLRVSRITFLSSHLAECPLSDFGCYGLLLALPEAVVLSPYRPDRAGQGASVLVRIGSPLGWRPDPAPRAAARSAAAGDLIRRRRAAASSKFLREWFGI